MLSTMDYQAKFRDIAEKTLFHQLPDSGQGFVRKQALQYRFTLQELRLVTEIALDLEMWNQGDITINWPKTTAGEPDKNRKKQLLNTLRRNWESLRDEPNRYPSPASGAGLPVKAEPLTRSKEKLGLGFCPVASAKTRCCNLLTLDVVENCGYGCTYCSIQSFFSGNQVIFDRDFRTKLAALPIDPDRLYHIGTGQSSDSLMWGNSHGVLDALIDFANRHPNVILELKTKSANIAHLLKQDVPANIICSWSLNPPILIANEEHATASLEQRLEAARSLADKGVVVGFHFHPMIHYLGWEQDYSALFARVQRLFHPDEVAMISIGTLTFTKPVIRKIRQSRLNSQILKMPLVEADGKLSYPDNVKLELFSHAYDNFSAAWKKGVFFYLCMENQRFWKPVFGFDFESNELFEQAMKLSYLDTIDRRRAVAQE